MTKKCAMCPTQQRTGNTVIGTNVFGFNLYDIYVNFRYFKIITASNKNKFIGVRLGECSANQSDEFPNKWTERGGAPDEFPPRWPNLTPTDLFLQGHEKNIVYSSPAITPQNM